MTHIEQMAKRIKLQHMRFALAVANQGSMGKAAKQLSISQPVVSKVIGELEKILGVALFDRSAHGIEPTHFGRSFLNRSFEILENLKSGVEDVRFLADPASGQLRFGGTDHLLASFGAAVMEKIWQQYPDISFNIVHADFDTLINHDLPERRIELAIVPLLKAPSDSRLEVTPLISDHLCVIAGMKSPWAKRRSIDLAELQNAPWCISPSPIGSLIAQSFRSIGLEPPKVTIATASAQMCLQMAESGRFIGHFGEAALKFFTKRFAVKNFRSTCKRRRSLSPSFLSGIER